MTAQDILASLLKSVRLCAGAFFVALALGGCALLVPQTEALRERMPAGLAEHIELADVPFFPQEDYQCGPAALATDLAYFGAKVTPEDLVSLVYLPARKGSLQVEMLAAPRRYGEISYQLKPQLEDVLKEVAAGNPVIALQYFGVWPIYLWHYAVVVGYDYQKGEVVLRSGNKKEQAMPFAVFEYIWKKGEHWAMVALPPGRIPATASESAYLDAVMALERVGDAGAAKVAYKAFVARWPDNLTARIGFANSAYALGELKEAESILRDTAVRYPDSPVVLNNLAQTVLDQGRNDEALQLIDKAGALGGDFAQAIAETRELILRRRGKNVN